VLAYFYNLFDFVLPPLTIIVTPLTIIVKVLWKWPFYFSFLLLFFWMAKQANPARLDPIRLWPVKIGSDRANPKSESRLRCSTHSANKQASGLARPSLPPSLLFFHSFGNMKNVCSKFMHTQISFNAGAKVPSIFRLYYTSQNQNQTNITLNFYRFL